jgi:GPH family glycoside/pentoside/hexuronide:cation symporter
MWLMIGLVILTSAGVGLYSPLLWSMYADVADYAIEQNGSSSTGLIFSTGTMAQKLGGAISGSLIAGCLSLAGATMLSDDFGNVTIDPASITPSVLAMIWSLFSIIPAGIALLMAGLTWLYPLRNH